MKRHLEYDNYTNNKDTLKQDKQKDSTQTYNHHKLTNNNKNQEIIISHEQP